AGQRLGDRAVDVADGLQHALAQVARLVAVAQLHRLLGAGGCTGRHGGAAERSIGERDFGFKGGIAAGVEDFAGVDPGDAGHGGGNVRWVESAVSLTEHSAACRGFLTGFRDLRWVGCRRKYRLRAWWPHVAGEREARGLWKRARW